ncbi:MAG: CBS domain-containing protein [Chloroflexales bacterium]|jgi:magnesium transporter
MHLLSQLLGRPVRGETNVPLGTLDDLVIRMEEGPYPSVTGLVVRAGRRRFFVPANQLRELSGVALLSSARVDLKQFQRREDEVLLGRDVLDHQIIDIAGHRVVRVNDIQITQVDANFRVVGVDTSLKAIVRRAGPRALADRIVGGQIIDWADLHYLAGTAPVRLKVSYDRLAELHPVDLARIVDALSLRESATIVAALDDETVAETLEEVSDSRLADLIEGMDQERAADILEEMDPGVAADVLEDLDDTVAEQLLAKMEPEEAAEIQTVLAYDEDSVGRIMITEIVRVAEGSTVGAALALLRSLDDVPNPLLAVYVVEQDQPETLRGIVRLRSLILADPATPLQELMDEDMPTIHPDAPAEQAARLLAEYNLLALPVIDDEEHLVGVVTVDDALAVLMPEIWQRRSSRMFH